MRTQHTAPLAAALAIATLALPRTQFGNNATDPHIPAGSLSAYPTQVQTGTNPQLTWNIEYPESANDVVTITPPGTITPTKRQTMDVRVVGASVKRVWLNNRGQVVRWEWVDTECQIKYGSENYSRIFFDKQSNVTPDQVVYSRIAEPGIPINFGGRYVQSNGSWSTWYSSTNSSQNVIALKDGDDPPNVDALYGQSTVEDFLRPYIDNQGNIDIGPKDVIYLVELTHTNPDHGGFDLQDLVILITFGNPNNGHGNNADGVDSSNPGQGGGGPTGDNNSGNDPSGGYDDELR